MQFFDISIDKKGIIADFFHAQRVEASDMLFGNLYIWHFSRSIKYAIIDDCLVVLTKFPNESYPFIFYPLGRGNHKNAILKMKEYFLDNQMPFSLRSLEQNQSTELENLFPNAFEITPNRDRFDYIYNVEDLILLSGRALHKKKNHLNRFFNLYPNFSYERIDSANALEVLGAYQKWFENSDKSEGLQNEMLGIKASLENFTQLDMKGGAIRIDGKIAAFSLGEQINADSVVIHIEKGNTFYAGIYQAINQQFLKNEWAHLRFVNREEDLGIEGLRKAKMSYKPAQFVEKSTAILKN
ncbi:DUF2156 domain-containing protein [Helicobacter sp. 23-1044]